MKITKAQLKETLRTIMKEESEYQQFFRKALDKAGKSITDMSDEEKKAFFTKIDAAWDGKGEKNEGNAFGAAVTAAKKAGEDEFKVGDKTYKVESVNKARKLKIGKEDFSYLLKLTDKELVKKLNSIRKQYPINYKQYTDAQSKGQDTSKIEKEAESLQTLEKAVIAARSMINFESVNEEKYTVIDPRGNQKGAGPKMQAAAMAKKLGGEKTGHFVVPNKNALKARRALEKFKGDFKNPKLKDMMADLFYESVNEVNLNKHVWEGWTVGAFIEELEPMFDMIMRGRSHQRPFKDKMELKRWLMDNQPYYKKHIPDVYKYFEKKYNELSKNESVNEDNGNLMRIGSTMMVGGDGSGMIKPAKMKLISIDYLPREKDYSYKFKGGGRIQYYMGSTLAKQLKNESVNEGRAFINAAKKAKAEGKTEFEFNGKTYPVTIKD